MKSMKKLKKIMNHDGLMDVEVMSGSMLPHFKVGQVVRIYPLGDMNKLKTFDIIVFKRSDIYIIHYFVEWGQVLGVDSGPRLITKALHGSDFDEPVHPSDVLGIASDDPLPLFLRTKEQLKALWRILLR